MIVDKDGAPLNVEKKQTYILEPPIDVECNTPIFDIVIYIMVIAIIAIIASLLVIII